MQLKQLIYTLLIFFSTSAFSQVTLKEKIALVCEVSEYADENLIHTQVNQIVNGLRKYEKLAPQKKVKKIFSAVKKNNLSNYYEHSFFPEIFSRNIYNCVTGTILMALVFDELNVPYSIVEVPRHIYLLAYPKTEKIAVESTSEKRGIYSWTEYSKRQAINFLLEIDEIKEIDIQVKGLDATLDEHFYANAELDFENLAGIQFFNKALMLNEKEDGIGALTFIDKANEYYNSPQTKLIEGSILSGLIGDSEYKDINIIYYLCRYYNVIDNAARMDKTESFIRLLFYEALHSRRDFEFADSSEVLIQSYIAPGKKQDKVMSLLYLEQSIWYGMHDQNEIALDRTIKGIALNPENLQFEDLLSQLLYQSMDEDMEWVEIDSFFQKNIEQYPFLMDNEFFFKVYISSYAYAASDAFYYGDIEDGWMLLSRISELIEEESFEKEDFAEPLSDMYGNISSYYYREKKYEKAMENVNIALSYSPDSKYLLGKKSYIQEKL